MGFWEKYPAPHHLEDVSVEELAQTLREGSRNTCSSRKAKEILDLVNRDGQTRREYQESQDFIVQSLVRDIKFKKAEIEKVEKQLKRTVALLGYKLETMPGIDTATACALVAQIGDINRFPNADKLARFAGIAPDKFSSAGKGKEQKSKQGNRILHGVFYFLAIQQVQVSKGTKQPRNPAMYTYYKRKISEGKTKVQTLVCLMRRLVNIVYGIMKNKTEYVMPLLPERVAV
jgi:transposase